MHAYSVVMLVSVAGVVVVAWKWCSGDSDDVLLRGLIMVVVARLGGGGDDGMVVMV